MYVFTEQILILQEHLFGYWTYTIFIQEHLFLITEQIPISRESLFDYHRADRQFPGRYSLSNRYFSNRSRTLVLSDHTTIMRMRLVIEERQFVEQNKPIPFSNISKVCSGNNMVIWYRKRFFEYT